MIAQVYPLRSCRCAAGEARDHQHMQTVVDGVVSLGSAEEAGGEGVDLSYPG